LFKKLQLAENTSTCTNKHQTTTGLALDDN
jgi:hypothetical protein